MKNYSFKHFWFTSYLTLMLLFVSCVSPVETQTDPCYMVFVLVTGTVINSPSPGLSTGSIAASASGPSGVFTYSINGGPYQTSGNFTGLAGGSYIITAKSDKGCVGNKTFTV